jgi:hypothetical protein
VTTIAERLNQATDVEVGFFASSGFIGKIIQWAEMGRVSHAFLSFKLPDLPGRLMFEADWPGVQIRPVGPNDNVFASFKPPSDVDLKAGLLEAVKLLGEDYDFAGLVGMIPVEAARQAAKKNPIFSWLSGLVKNPLQKGDAEFCSELACLAMQSAKWPATFELDRHSVDPEQLLVICEVFHG